MAADPHESSGLDNWDDIEDPGPGLANQFSSLNVAAKPFIPNMNAPAFVPSYGNATNTKPDLDATGNVPTDAAQNSAGFGNEDAVVMEAQEQEEEELEEEIEEEEEEEEAMQEDEVPVPEASVKDNGSMKAFIAPKPSKQQAVREEEPESKKEHVNVVFIGHVDAGKSTIGGHIMYLTGGVDKRTLEKYEREAKEKNRESWYLSWALDTNQEERDKGKTVEVGRAYFETEKKHFTILDAPGHRSFVPNMIGGAAQADLAVLVISARKGEFETGFERGGQTREHAMLAKTAGVKHLVILVNKMDDHTVEWSVKRYEECKEKLLPFLRKVGFNPKKDIHFIPVSGITGANLKTESDQCPWYTGAPFIKYIDDLPPLPARNSQGPLRLPITDRYKDMGTILLGKVESGNLRRGGTYTLMPNKTNVEVLQIISDEDETNFARTGENVKLKVRGVEEDDVCPGFVLCDTTDVCHTSKMFDAQIAIVEYKSIICPGYGAVLHIHNACEEVQITKIIALIDKKTGAKTKQRPRFIKQDHVAIARLETTGVLCMETFKEFSQMGRFTLRDEGKTIAIGKVLKLL
ncbi:eukaryotic peptide chain release factor GTP-binding subunit ERF3A [Strongylocentrotus purpuratus]|uniref:Tr-type G domain-containing protein n=1 Tax=Strongylocentrotus purpuratus TaxID=7668 RepID=A0A7M7NQP2_STRPU|nr:eukaryotic peptide chain release factor GTP-binding subunit ERF3A [Strongylocentrotus purpuratus]|eukprot:XP_003730424.1 PREDICTED: eukaryotic peptide chain release factor GTP-binding subunit ERF3A [Strongylocentrotus purpuratus]